MVGFKTDIARTVVRHRGWIAVAWLIACAALLSATGRLDQALDVSARIDGSEAAQVESLLATRFYSPFAYYAVLVVAGVPSPDSGEGARLLEQVVTVINGVPGVTRSFSYLDISDTLFLASGAPGTFVVVGLDPKNGPLDVLIPRLRAATEPLQNRLRQAFPDVALRWTGDAALNSDLRRTSTEEARAAEQRVLPVTIALLLLAFGAVAAAILPVLTGVLAIVIALGAAVLLAERWPLSILLVNVVSMIGLGLGIDYALLTVSRFRESLSAGPIAAAEEAARHAGHTVLLSGAAVAIGFAALLIVPVNELRSVAVGGLLVVVASVALAATLLPALLAWVGRWIDAGRLKYLPPWRLSEKRWRSWGDRVAKNPKLILLLAGTPVLLLALQAPRMNTAIPRGNWLPPRMESARAVRDLEAMGRGGIIQTTRIVVEFPAGTTVLQPEGWAATWRLIDSLAADPHVTQVRFLPGATKGPGPNPILLSLLPRDVRRSFITDDGRAALVEVIPRQNVEPNELTQWVRKLRTADPALLTGLGGVKLRVGGLPAFNADYEDAVAGRFSGIVLLIVLGTLAALSVGFRSVLIPIKAVALNLLSVAAAFGALVLVFQDGYGAGWMGIAGPTDGVFPAVPILVFCTVFGLSMDYEVFFVARVAEARRAGMDEADALKEGLAKTAGVITSAAAIMIAVFAAFALGDFLLIKMLGFALATAVFLDATVVRIAIGPALLRLAGRWNWWPGDADGISIADRKRVEPGEERGLSLHD